MYVVISVRKGLVIGEGCMLISVRRLVKCVRVTWDRPRAHHLGKDAANAPQVYWCVVVLRAQQQLW